MLASIKKVYGPTALTIPVIAPIPVTAPMDGTVEKPVAKKPTKKEAAAPTVNEKKPTKRGKKKAAPAAEEKKPTKRGKQRLPPLNSLRLWSGSR